MPESYLHCGDCLAFMREVMEPDSVDSIITDPPYGLAFMGKHWDRGLPDPAVWRECLRVAKPGAFLLAFGGTRTFHRLACHIEDAGFELRDCLCWLYGTGFPKSLNISAALDKAAGAERQILGPGKFANRGRRTDNNVWQKSTSSAQEVETAPATPEAALWQGFGTALKPAWEPIIVAMKPLAGTFADNALAHGVAGLNIDGARLETGPTQTRMSSRVGSGGRFGVGDGRTFQSSDKVNAGRWPANVILDEEAGAMLDAQVGERGAHAWSPEKSGADANFDLFKGAKGVEKGSRGKCPGGNQHFDSGGPSRFFYCSKASRSERGDANKHPTVKPLALMRWLCRLTRPPQGGLVFDPFSGSGTTGVAAIEESRDFIGCELEAEHFATAQARIDAALATCRPRPRLRLDDSEPAPSKRHRLKD